MCCNAAPIFFVPIWQHAGKLVVIQRQISGTVWNTIIWGNIFQRAMRWLALLITLQISS